MTDKKNSLEQYSTIHCQNLIRKYSGTGILKQKNNKGYPCEFEVGQLVDGRIVLTCDCPDSYMHDFQEEISLDTAQGFKFFEGLTNKSESINGKINLCTKLANGIESFILTFFLKEICVNSNNHENLQQIAFGITNFKFEGNKFNGTVLTLDIEELERLEIKKINEYEDALNFLKAFKGICITCEIIVKINKEIDIENIKTIVTDLCMIMSIAQGRKIEWIYYYIFNNKGKIVLQKHENRITKPYSAIEIIDEESEDMQKFLESSYKVLVKNQYLLKNNSYIVNAYLDAKLQNDFLEQRGLKLVLVTELFKELLLRRRPELELIVNEEVFKKLKPHIQTALKKLLKQSADFDSHSRGKIYENVSGLNRTPFPDILACFCKYINLQVDMHELQLIVKCRNSLVHTGTFFCRNDECTDDYRTKYPQLQSPVSEYFFLLNFVDKCFLKLLCYDEFYLNWTNPSEIKREKLI
jgi:hypothetical protein